MPARPLHTVPGGRRDSLVSDDSEKLLADPSRLHRVSFREPLFSPRHIRLLKLYPPGWPDRVNEPGLAKDFDLVLTIDAYQVLLDDVETDGPPSFLRPLIPLGCPGCGPRRDCSVWPRRTTNKAKSMGCTDVGAPPI